MIYNKPRYKLFPCCYGSALSNIEKPGSSQANYFDIGGSKKFVKQEVAKHIFDHLSLKNLTIVRSINSVQKEEVDQFIKILRTTWSELKEMDNYFLNLDVNELDFNEATPEEIVAYHHNLNSLKAYKDFLKHIEGKAFKCLLKERLLTVQGISELAKSRPFLLRAFFMGIDDGSSIQGLRKKMWTEMDMLNESTDLILLLMQPPMVHHMAKKQENGSGIFSSLDSLRTIVGIIGIESVKTLAYHGGIIAINEGWITFDKFKAFMLQQHNTSNPYPFRHDMTTITPEKKQELREQVFSIDWQRY